MFLHVQGAIESVIAAMKAYPRDTELQRACAMAIASLSRLESNREKIGSSEAIGRHCVIITIYIYVL